jgi:sporulation protein YlmC with PRC-barrel domain
MFRSIKSLSNYAIYGTDGYIGKTSEFLFNEKTWKVRYLVVETDTRFPDRTILLAPTALGQFDLKSQMFTTEKKLQPIREEEQDPYLPRTEDVIGYTIHALDGEIGAVEDLIVDDEAWSIRYLVVNTGSWLSGKNVLVLADWIRKVEWLEEKVYLDSFKREVKNSLEYNPSDAVNQEQEIRLYDYYSRPK